MEFSLREWLILIGVVIILGILIDGFRRYKKAQVLAQSDDDDDFVDPDELIKEAMIRRELPNGGARPIAKEPRVATSPAANAFENARKTAKAPLSDLPHKVDAGPTLERGEEMHLDELASLVPERDFSEPDVSTQDYSDGEYEQANEYDFTEEYQAPSAEPEAYEEAPAEPAELDYERDYSTIDVDQMTPQGVQLSEEEEQQTADEAEIEEVIVINIFAPENQAFSGMELLQLVLNCGMRYGDMDIFHRHEDGFDRGRVQFSMANAIEPGTFDLDTMGETECPGVSFFMGLPGPKNSMKAFDFMLETAQTIVRNLGGELRDERRSPMSEQTIAHCRQRIRDFERRRLTRRN